MKTIRASLLVSVVLLFGIARLSKSVHSAPNLVPNDLRFWDNSENWTTDYGPAYRDTLLKPVNLVPCTGTFALCASSGPEPLPCELTKDGRFANCTCTAQTRLHFVIISAILNFEVWLETVAQCGDGSGCVKPDSAPVCKAINSGNFIPDADLISAFDPGSEGAVTGTFQGQQLLVCPKAPYASCMTAPCTQKKGENPVCSCPVFNGVFQLPTSRVPSAT